MIVGALVADTLHMADEQKRIRLGIPLNCSRRSCGKSPAEWFNHSTRHYYCEECATMLNDTHRVEALALYGHDLCTKKGGES